MKSYVNQNWPRLLAVMIIAAAFGLGMMPDPALAGAAMVAPFLAGEVSTELKQLLESQGKAWEEYKKVNDQAVAEGKQHSAEVREKLGKIGGDLDRLTTALKDVEVRTQRMSLELGGNGQKDGLTPEQRAHKAGFQSFMRKGVEAGLSELQEKAMSVGSDADGGYFVPQDTSGRIIQKIFETSPMRQHASVQPISTDALEGPNDLNDGVVGGWVGETAARTTTGTPQVGKWRIPVHEIFAQPEITQTLLDDSAIDVEAWLGNKVSDKMGRTETTAFFTGTGVGQPRGLLTYTTAATADATRAWGVFEHVLTGSAGSFGAAGNGSDKLVDLVHKIKAAYRANSRFWMSRATLGETRKLKDAAGNYIWLPSAGQAERGIAGVPPSTLLGYPVVEAEDMPAIAANSLSIGFGNMNLTYQIVDRIGIRVLRDPFTNKPFIRFYTTRRVGGDALHFESFKFLKFA